MYVEVNRVIDSEVHIIGYIILLLISLWSIWLSDLTEKGAENPEATSLWRKDLVEALVLKPGFIYTLEMIASDFFLTMQSCCEGIYSFDNIG